MIAPVSPLLDGGVDTADPLFPSWEDSETWMSPRNNSAKEEKEGDMEVLASA